MTRPLLHWHHLPPAALHALLDLDLERASELVGAALTPYFTLEKARWTWRYRLDQLAQTPQDAAWIARAVSDAAHGQVVGHAGFHGGPDAAGMVEVSYSVDPAWRRRGYAGAMLRGLLDRAATEPDVKIVRATISPDNAASLATLRPFGFTHVGEQMDDIDGLELIFERAAQE
ncbi:GNAT family protein [Deinococcus sp.]|uniref:GNAT family N-acetyltransferase n=1 Tax=Deinococcus sp. TaxID=47478 RepID=UPI0025FD5675|nr:GNAT family protein [Deinococcus sp.]